MYGNDKVSQLRFLTNRSSAIRLVLDCIVLLSNLGLWELKHGNSSEPFFKRIDENKQGQDAKGPMGARSSLETLR